MGSAVAILVGSCVMWIPLWLVGAGEVPGELVEFLSACALSLVGGLSSYVRVPWLGAGVRVLCLLGAVGLGWVAVLLYGSDVFAGEEGVEQVVVGVVVLGAVGMLANAIWRPAALIADPVGVDDAT